VENKESILKEKVLQASRKYYEFKHKIKKPFQEGDRVNYAGRVFDEKEIEYLVDSALEFWLTTGRYAHRFEKELAEFLNVSYCSLTNSGSSANLLALAALTSPKLGKKRIKKGDEVITVAAAFPTTVAPIVQIGAIPVFVDVDIPSYNIDCSILEKALSKKTKAVVLAHTLGNPFNVEYVKSFCDKNDIWLIEDNCDALGSKYLLKDEWKYTGTFGHMSTCSFFPPHHITMGEGGAVCTNDPQLKRNVLSFRDWGRDCWCEGGYDNTCNKRFNYQFGELPFGYDHKSVSYHFGYNMKVTDMQAAVGCAQLMKLPDFIEKRKHNWLLLRDGLDELKKYFILPEAEKNSDPSWFGFLLTVRNQNKITRDDIVKHLENTKIQTRMLFGGNIIKHPCFDEMRKSGKGYRVVGDLKNTDKIMNDSFWLGVYPGLSEAMIQYMITIIKKFIRK
jgi:CDP-6-deoxy-D-xylo-4-hexulose-3-dehydrase